MTEETTAHEALKDIVGLAESVLDSLRGIDEPQFDGPIHCARGWALAIHDKASATIGAR